MMPKHTQGGDFRKKLVRGMYYFFFPQLTPLTLLRMLVVTVVAAGIFGFVLQPCFINGESMQPAYKNGFAFCNLLRYRFSSPERGDVVVISYFGRKYLLKRIIALAGEKVEFRNGKAFVNGVELQEPYVSLPCDWNMKPVIVASGSCFVVGDNRSQLIDEHLCGVVGTDRIIGGLLF